MQERLDALEREVRRLRLYTGALTAVSLVVIASAFTRSHADDVIRTHGIVVLDSAGRERILIGAPVPGARNRVRTDPTRVEKEWAGRYPDPKQYMRYYAGYRNDVNGVLVLDERGFDRLALGDPVPDPNIARRIGPSTGLVINDSAGFERSGYGLLNVGGRGRVVLGLDTNRGAEGVALAVMDGYGVGINVQDEKRMLFVGAADSSFDGVTAPFFGGILRDGSSVIRELNIAAPGAPRR